MGKRRACQRATVYVEKDGRTNELFEAYYQKVLNLSEQDFYDLFQALKEDLPSTFRVTGFREHSKEVQFLLKNKFIESLIKDMPPKDDGKPLVTNLPWYPGELAWQINASKMEIRKTPELRKLHQFLVSETNCGFISRQEAVSMIPPLLLDVQSHHKVLDLCAAPGSKTAQLIEMLHANCEGTPTGVVVANDIDNKRCYMMVHQLQRLQSPCSVVVRQDASIFPRFMLGQSQMLFDRILVDVPCSGDGTLRKNPSIWPRWTPFLGINEHVLQIKILKRALEMLADGGRLVYSTCSLSPSEDEAVVANMLAQTGDSCELLDISEIVPNLEAAPGLTNWSVMLKDKTWIDKYEDIPLQHKRSIKPSLFPPQGIEQMNMQYCRRVLPNTSNTGGFFLAVIHKKSCLPWMNSKKLTRSTNEEVKKENENIVDIIEDVETTNLDIKNENIDNVDDKLYEGPAKKKARIYKEDPFFFVEDNDGVFGEIKRYYDLLDEFPYNQLMYRNGGEGRRRNFYFTNDLLKQIVKSNENKINFVNMGVKIFGNSEDKVYQGYRLLQEGMEIADPFIGSARRLTIHSRKDLIHLFSYDYPLITEFDEILQKQFDKVSVGPVVFQYFPKASDDQLPRINVIFAGWRGATSIRSYVGQFERCHMLRICGEEPSPQMEATRNGKPEQQNDE